MIWKMLRRPLLLLLVALQFSWLLAYQIPEPKLEMLTEGFRVSIPDEEGVRIVAFNINRNRPFKSFEQGEFSARLVQPTAGRWVYENRRTLNVDDVLWIWTHVQYNDAVYRFSAIPYAVNAAAKGSQSMSPTPTVEVPTRTVATVTQPKPSPPSSPCQSTITEYTGGSAGRQGGVPCAGQLIFEDNFDGSALDLQLWLHEQRLPLDNGDAEFVLYRPRAHVADGLMRIEPMLYTEMDIRNGSLELNDGCTAQLDREKECKRHASFPNVLPPVVTGRINTRQSFSFKYGRVEVRAKLPQGDWLFPLILLEPLINAYGLSPYDSGQLRIAFARGNSHLAVDGLSLDGHTLYGGAVLPVKADLRARSLVNTTRTAHFGADFHVYEMTWSDHALSFAVDGSEYGRLLGKFANLDYIEPSNAQAWQRGERMAPFDQKFFITLGVSAGGHGDFPDNAHDKPWVNTDPKAMFHFWKERTLTTGTWTSPALQVDYVRVYSV